jgi:hypothetical protein
LKQLGFVRRIAEQQLNRFPQLLRAGIGNGCVRAVAAPEAIENRCHVEQLAASFVKGLLEHTISR